MDQEMQAALAAVKSGQDVDTALGRESTSVGPDDVLFAGEHRIDASEYRGEDNPLDGLFGGVEGESAEAGVGESAEGSELSLDGEQEGEDADGSQPPESDGETDGNLVELTVTDDKGRRKIKVDFSDQEKLKKYVRMAHGARKWQAERDSARSELSDVSSKLSELQSNWDAIEKAYQTDGVRGLVELLDGGDAYQQYEQSLLERHELRKNATPAELEALEAREAAERRDRELERIRLENEKFREQMAKEKETAELKALESRIHPAFDRFRFKGKLGDANDEHMFDQMLWNAAMRNLEPYEEKGITITQELAEKEFARVANTLRKRINANVDKKVTKAVEKKKEEATATAQKSVMRGVRDNSETAEASKMLQSGDIAGFMRNWGKFGKLLS